MSIVRSFFFYDYNAILYKSIRLSSILKVFYIRLEDKFIILLANLDVRLGILIFIYRYIWSTHRQHYWVSLELSRVDGDTPLNKICSVYRPLVVTTKLSSIVSMKKKKKTDRTRCCNSWHHTLAKRWRHARQASKKKGSIYVIEDTTRRRERGRKKKGKKKWMEFDACVDGSDSNTTKFSILHFCSVSFFLSLSLSIWLHHTINTKKKEKEKNAYSIFRIFKQVSVLFLSSMFVYSSWCTGLDDLRYSRFF